MSKDFKKGLAGMIGGQEESPKETPRKTRDSKAPSEKALSKEPKSSASQEAKRPGVQETKKKDLPKYKAFTKVNYYLAPELVKRIKVLSAKQGRELSDLADEAMRDLLKKHKAE
jgi:hypothetical protein